MLRNISADVIGPKRLVGRTIAAGIGGHVAGFNTSLEATGQPEFDPGCGANPQILTSGDSAEAIAI